MRISKLQQKKYNELTKDMKEAILKVYTAQDTYNERVRLEHEELSDAAEKFNETVTAFEEFRDSVHTDLFDTYDSKSEKWQESEAGENVQKLIEKWDEGISTIEVPDVEDVEIDFDFDPDDFDYPFDSEEE